MPLKAVNICILYHYQLPRKHTGLIAAGTGTALVILHKQSLPSYSSPNLGTLSPGRARTHESQLIKGNRFIVWGLTNWANGTRYNRWCNWYKLMKCIVSAFLSFCQRSHFVLKFLMYSNVLFSFIKMQLLLSSKFKNFRSAPQIYFQYTKWKLNCLQNVTHGPLAVTW